MFQLSEEWLYIVNTRDVSLKEWFLRNRHASIIADTTELVNKLPKQWITFQGYVMVRDDEKQLVALLHLVVGTVAVLSKDDDRPGVDVNTLVELLPSHVPHT